MSRLLFALYQGSAVMQVSFIQRPEQVLIFADAFYNMFVSSGAPTHRRSQAHANEEEEEEEEVLLNKSSNLKKNILKVQKV